VLPFYVLVLHHGSATADSEVKRLTRLIFHRLDAHPSSSRAPDWGCKSMCGWEEHGRRWWDALAACSGDPAGCSWDVHLVDEKVDGKTLLSGLCPTSYESGLMNSSIPAKSLAELIAEMFVYFVRQSFILHLQSTDSTLGLQSSPSYLHKPCSTHSPTSRPIPQSANTRPHMTSTIGSIVSRGTPSLSTA
jgi:hypothetical protein